MKSDLFLAGKSEREIPIGVRRGEPGYLYTQRLVNHPLQFSPLKIPLLSLHSKTTNRRSPVICLTPSCMPWRSFQPLESRIQ